MTTNRLIGYVRVSTEEQGETGVSLADQRARLTAYATSQGVELLLVEQDVVSGSVEPLRRPGLARALAALRNGEAGGLLVVKLDRLSRSLRDTIDLVELSRKQKWRLCSVSENLDTGSPMGSFFVSMLGALAQLERETIAERTRNGMRQLAREGRRRSRFAPFGYEIVGDQLRDVPREQGTLAVMRALFADGCTLAEIAAQLTADGSKQRNGRKWSAANVRRILSTAQSRSTI